MGLKQNLLRGIFEFGFEKPTAIQQRAIVPMTSGRDVIVQADSRTGHVVHLRATSRQCALARGAGAVLERHEGAGCSGHSTL